MMSNDVIDEVFHRLYGQPCWQVTRGWGTFITLEFGRPSLEVREPRVPGGATGPGALTREERRRVWVRGQWHLWIYCCDWQVVTGNKRIGHSNLKGSSKKPIDRGAFELDGQKLMRVSVNPSEGSSLFEFDLGSRLETRPYDDSEQWMLYEPSGYVFTYRADGLYSHQPGDTPPDETVWQRV